MKLSKKSKKVNFFLNEKFWKVTWCNIVKKRPKAKKLALKIRTESAKLCRTK